MHCLKSPAFFATNAANAEHVVRMSLTARVITCTAATTTQRSRQGHARLAPSPSPHRMTQHRLGDQVLQVRVVRAPHNIKVL
jgi:hypothetical protein